MNTNKNQVPQCDKTAVMQSVIKGQSLRIGNLVYYNGNHNEIGVVSEIFKNDFAKVAPYKIGINHRVDIYYDVDRLKPIKTTKEFLTKMGFFIVETNGSFEATLPNFRYSIQTQKDYDGFFFCDGETVLTNFNYLHELQNLVFVLGQRELTVA
jgi:hypothetical protein